MSAPVLAALSFTAIAEIVLSIALVPFIVGYLIRRRRRIPLSWLLARNGHVVLSDKGRVRISNRGLDVSEVESSLNETFAVDEDGDIVLKGAAEGG
jgi:hypothetical protein